MCVTVIGCQWEFETGHVGESCLIDEDCNPEDAPDGPGICRGTTCTQHCEDSTTCPDYFSYCGWYDSGARGFCLDVGDCLSVSDCLNLDENPWGGLCGTPTRCIMKTGEHVGEACTGYPGDCRCSCQ